MCPTVPVANRETVTDFVVARYFSDGEESFCPVA